MILASSSRPRSVLLQRFGIPFEAIPPDIDEEPRDNELPHDLAARLACEKALAIAGLHTDAVVIGSDQVVVHGGRYVGKPGNAENAVAQLAAFGGQTVQFLTGVAAVRDGRDIVGHAVVETRVEFRALDTAEIERYVQADQPFSCAGGFKAESLGPALFESSFSQDPTALIGLPLIETARLLRKAGFQVP